MAKIGDNGVNGGQLRAFIERIERIAEIKAAATEDMKEVYEEAKSTGFDPKIMRKVVSMRRIDADKRRAEQEMIDLYLEALGMLADTPFGQAAISAATA
jgi:uncharacterized protein (UPF0335 family)